MSAPRTTARLALLVLSLFACAPAQSPQAKPATPTFTETVAPIVFARCAACHRPGEVAPFPLLTYADVKKRGKMIAKVTEQRYMPPWHPAPGHGEFRDAMRLEDGEVAAIRAWVAGGMPEGPAAALPKPPEFPAGWQLGEPDLVVRTKAPFDVPASGRDVYRSFAVSLGLPEDAWVTAIEVRPSARAALHHVLFFVDEEREAKELDGRDGKPGFSAMGLRRAPMIGGWAVGGMPQHLPEGLAVRVPANSDLVLQCHFHPSGKKEQEQTVIGLHFAKEPPKRTLVPIQLPPFFGVTAGIDIPAGEKQWLLADTFTLPCDVDCVTVGGHAHMLCTTVRLQAELPDGKKEPLLLIPRWDFDWQNRYTYASLVRLPKGSVIRAELTYDNSEDNPANPNRPPKRVRWGRESTDEMGSVTLMVVPADEKDLPALRDAVRAKSTEKVRDRVSGFAEQFLARHDANKDGKLQRAEVPARMRRMFDELDKNADGVLTKEEMTDMGSLLPGGLPGEGGGGRGGGR